MGVICRCGVIKLIKVSENSLTLVLDAFDNMITKSCRSCIMNGMIIQVYAFRCFLLL